MRAITRIALTVFIAAAVLPAQTTPPPAAAAPGSHRMAAMSQRGFDRMAQHLNLTDVQRNQIQGIFQTQRQQARTIAQDTTLTPQQRQDKLRLLRESTHQQVSAVLTPEQQQQMRQMRFYHEGMGGMGPLRRLNLTPEQKAQIRPIMHSTHQQVQAVHADTSLTPEQKKAKVREIRLNARTQIESLLTPEQQQQFKDMRRGPGGKHGPPPPPPSGF